MTLLPQITASSASDRTLPIAPVVQRSPVWCWAAVGEMVFKYFGSQNADPGSAFQCAIVEAMAGTSTLPCARDCYSPNCIAGGRDPKFLTDVFRKYPERAAQTLLTNQPRLHAAYKETPLTVAQIKDVLDAGSPIIAGVSPIGLAPTPGASQHLALIVGYQEDGRTLLVNDPGHYELLEATAGDGNPYIRAGGIRTNRLHQYIIPAQAFTAQLAWIETVIVSRTGEIEAEGGRPLYCCTKAGRYGPYPYLSLGGAETDIGAQCLGKHQITRGTIPGTVCR